MAENSYPLVPSNYVTIHDLQERWMKRQREDQEKEQQPKHEPALSQSQRRNHVGRGEGSSSASAIVSSSNRPGSAMADSQAEKSRVWGVDEQSACVAVEEKGTKRASKGKRKKTKKKKLGVDGNGKTQLDEDANGGTEHMSAGKVAGESASSTDLLKDGTFKAEVKCVITKSRAMQQSQPKIKSHNHARIGKVSGDSIPMERKIPEENQDGEGSSSASGIVPSSNRPGSAMADSQAEKSRVWGVDEQSACVAVEEKGTKRASKGKRKKTKKKLGVDGKGKTQLDEDANGGTEHMSAGKVAGESASSTDLLKDGTFKAEVKCVITESRAMQQSQPKIKSHNHARVRKVSGDSIPMERKIPEENQDGLDTVTHPQINIAYPANPTFKIEGEFKKLSMQGNRRDNRGRGGRRGGQSDDMVWVKKVEKVDAAQKTELNGVS